MRLKRYFVQLICLAILLGVPVSQLPAQDQDSTTLSADPDTATAKTTAMENAIADSSALQTVTSGSLMQQTPAFESPAAYNPVVTNTQLQDYIRLALESNEGLRQAKLDYAINLSALKEAKGLFFPEISLDARYTVAEGGRIISFPIGDLLNPVYSTLNLLTLSEQFPQVENEEFPFYRPTEQETKVRLVQPIFKSDLIHNVRIRKQAGEIAKINIEQYKQNLVREVTKAYYSYQKAYLLNALADTTMDLVKENLRVSKSLYNNDKVTVDAIYRSQAEVSKVEVKQAQTRMFLESSRAYFNFLLNRDLAEEIDLGNANALAPATQRNFNTFSLDEAELSALSKRQELNQLKAYQQLNERQTDLYKGGKLPGMFGVVDYGVQGEDYSITADDDFVMASVVLQWTLFQGRANHQKIQQSKIEGEKLQSMYSQAEQQIRMEVINSYLALQSARESVRSAQAQMRAARRAFTLVHRKYQEGQASLLELIDARTGLTDASTNVIIAQSDYNTGLADFKYAIGQTTYNK